MVLEGFKELFIAFDEYSKQLLINDLIKILDTKTEVD